MKEYNRDFANYSMNSSSDEEYDDEEIIEEIIERDEIYDDEVEGEEYYDDEEYYDEEGEYDDEEEYYDEEEEYYDEEEPEEEYYDEEPQEEYYEDDGYDNQYYDDRFNRVLDEIAELKKSVGASSPAVIPQTVPYSQPYIINTPTPSAGSSNEVVMYNEISRLRDELHRTQNSADLHLEIGRMKEQMEKEQRQRESELQSEIRRLNEKLDRGSNDDVKRVSSSNYASLPASSFDSAGVETIRSDISRLISICEGMLKSSHDFDVHTQREIADIKRKITDMPDFLGMSKSIEALKGSFANVSKAGGTEKTNSEVLQKLDALKKEIIEHTSSLGASVNTGLSAAMSKLDGQQSNVTDSSLPIQMATDNDNSEILRQIYEIKSVLGNPSTSEIKHNAIMLELYNDFSRVKADAESNSISLGEKLAMIDKFAKKLGQSSEAEALDIFISLERICDRLLATPLSKSVAEALAQFAETSRSVSLNAEVKSAVLRYVTACDKMRKGEISDCVDSLADLISEINIIQNNKFADSYDTLYVDVDNLVNDYIVASDADEADKIERQIRSKIDPLTKLTANDVINYTPPRPPKIYKSVRLVEENKALFDKIDELSALVADFSVSALSASGMGDVNVDLNPILEEIVVLKDDIYAAAQSEQILSQIDALRADVLQTIKEAQNTIVKERHDSLNTIADIKSTVSADDGSFDDVLTQYNDIKQDYLDILGRITELSESVAVLGQNESVTANDTIDNSQILDDLNYIRERLDAQDTLIHDIKTIASEPKVIARPEREVNENLSSTGTVDANLLNEFVAQLDKLYEDIVVESGNPDNPLNKHLEEIATLVNEGNQGTSAKLDDLALSTMEIGLISEKADSIVDKADQLNSKIDEVLISTSEIGVVSELANSISDRLEELVNLVNGYSATMTAEKDEQTTTAQFEDFARTVTESNNEANTVLLENTTISLTRLDEIAGTIAENSSVAEEKIDEVTNALLENSAIYLSRFDDLSSLTNDNSIVLTTKIDELSASINESLINNANKIDEISTAVLTSTQPENAEKLDEVLASNIEISAKLDETVVISNEINLKLDESVVTNNEIASKVEDISASTGILTERFDEISQAVNEGITSTSALTVRLEEINAVMSENSLNSSLKIDEISVGVNDVLVNFGKISEDISEIKERIFAQSLEESAQAVSASEEEKSALIREISVIRDRISATEDVTREQSDLLLTQTNMLLDEVSLIRDTVTAARTAEMEELSQSRTVALDDTTLLTLNDINDKLTNILYGADDMPEQDNISSIIVSVNDIRDKVAASESVSDDIAKILEDLSFIRSLIEDNVSDSNGSDEQSTFASQGENIDSVVEELTAIKEKLSYLDEQDMVAEIMSLREEIKASKILEQNDVLRELEAVHGELSGLKDDLAMIADIRSELNTYHDEIKTKDMSTSDVILPTNDEVNMILSEIVSLRDEIQAYKDELSTLTTAERAENAETAPTAYDEESINALMDEVTNLRADIQGYNEETVAQKTDLEEIKGSVDELKDLISRRTKIAEKEDGDAASSASEELNVILDEIINLKDSIESVKSDIANVKATQEAAQQSELASIKELLYQLVADKEDEKQKAEAQNEQYLLLTSELDFIKNQISDIALSNALGDNVVETNSVEEQNNLILGEITALREQFDVNAEHNNEAIYEEITTLREQLDSLLQSNSDVVTTEIAALRDEVTTLATQRPIVKAAMDENEELSANTIDILFNEISALRDEVASREIKTELKTIESKYDSIVNEVAALRNEIVLSSSDDEASDMEGADRYGDISEQIARLSDEIQATIQLQSMEKEDSVPATDKLDEIFAQIEDLRTQLSIIGESNNDIVLHEVASIKEDVQSLKSSMIGNTDGDSTQNDSLNIIFDEISALRMQLSVMQEGEAQVDLSAITSKLDALQEHEMGLASDYQSLLTEVLSLREVIDLIHVNGQKDGSESSIMAELNSALDEIRQLKDEPDLSLLNEILALRDEFQAFKDEVATSKVRSEASIERERTADAVLGEVQSLRDQLFAISMASVNDGTGNAATYESYNNIILDEISALRDELNTLKNAETLAAVVDEIASIKESIKNDSSSDTIREQLFKLKQDLDTLKIMESSDDASNNAILNEISTLKAELSNQRDADEATVNFMSELAHLLERQNQYINQVANTKITDQMETLKHELAATLSSIPALSGSNSEVINEIAKLKSEINQSSAESIDSHEILEELSKLKEQISRDKSSEENRVILSELSRVRDEIKTITERGSMRNSTDVDLSRSINDLKYDLTQIADIVTIDGPTYKSQETNKTAKKSSATKSSKTTKSSSVSGSSTSSRSGTTKSSGQSKSKKPSTVKKSTTSRIETVLTNDSLSGDKLLSKIEAESSELLSSSSQESYLSLNASEISPQEDLELASRLAKQVADKLIMEQLVQQLGDGGMPKSKVEEIVKDILPQEFTTVAMDAQTDKVRRLANSLVLDKLRARLTRK